MFLVVSQMGTEFAFVRLFFAPPIWSAHKIASPKKPSAMTYIYASLIPILSSTSLLFHIFF